ncbi:MAG TPA: PIN domain-containing protein [Chloroflexota bacterium]|nr:PIN domain-containing protein [Chloroflexota bacterium]
MILVDTGGLLAALDPRQAHHQAAARALLRPRRRLLSPFVLAEADYLIATNAGQAEELKLLRDVARGAYQLEPFGAADVAAANTVMERYADLRLGLADASIVVLADRHGVHDILTLDQRHFRAVLGPGSRPFRLLPLDEEADR